MTALISTAGRARSLDRLEFSAPAERRRAKRFKTKTANVTYLEFRRTLRGRSYKYYALFYFLNGRRMRETRASYAAAEARAEAIDRAVQNGEINMLSLREADRGSFERTREIAALDPSKRPVELIVAEGVDGAKLAAGTGKSLLELARLGKETLALDTIQKTMPEAVSDMLRRMERDGAGKRWIEDLEGRLARFTEKYTGPISELRAPTINAWLDGLDVGPRSRNNYRIALMTLAAFCKDHNYLPRKWSEMEDVKRAKERPKPIEIYTPEETSRLLSACKANLEPFVALQAFAGIRTRELLSLDWRYVKLARKRIDIPLLIAKEGTPERIIPIQDNLAAWLQRRAKSSGPICSLANVTNALRHTAKRAGVRFIRNGLRKGFISYRLPIVGDIGKVAMEAGNSPTIIDKHYRLTQAEEDAQRYFALYPPKIEDPQLRLAGL